MTEFNVGQLYFLLPEIILVTFVLIAQILVMFKIINSKTMIVVTLFGLGIIIYFSITYFMQYEEEIFDSSYKVTSNFSLIKCILWIALFLILITYSIYCTICKKKVYSEYVLLASMATIGSSIAISAQHAILLFVALELQSIAAYILIGMYRNNITTAEANLQYFILSSFITCLFLLGWSLIYGFSGILQYDLLKVNIFRDKNISLAISTGFILIIFAVLFKIGAAPFHLWLLNIYQETSIITLIFLTFIPKAGYLIVLSNLLFLSEDIFYITDIVRYVAIFSMIVGAIGGLKQISLKRLLAYSTINHIGYLLLPIIVNYDYGWKMSIIYLCVYSVAILGILFGLIICGEKVDDLRIEELRGLASYKKGAAFIISVMLLSLIGIPPLAGFFVKYQVFFYALQQGEYVLVLFGLITTIISSYYYLMIIKLMYFEKTLIKINTVKCSLWCKLINFVSCIYITFYSLIGL